MTPAEIEGEAAWLYTRAGADPLSPPPAERVAANLLGTTVRRVDSRLLRGGDACFTRLHGEPVIWIRRGLTPERQRFVVMHEVAEWHLRELDYREGDVEDCANAIGAALVAPRAAFRQAVRDHGETAFSDLAHDFTATQTCAALRVGEAAGTPIAVIAPGSVRVRGDDFAWPDERSLRKVAASGAPGLRKVALSDAKRRIVLLSG